MPPAKYEIFYLPGANADIADIAHYIAVTLAAPEAASLLLDKIDDAIMQLQIFPYAHRIYPTEIDTANFEIRALIVDSYIVMYCIEDAVVTIVRVVYGSRDIQNILRKTTYTKE